MSASRLIPQAQTPKTDLVPLGEQDISDVASFIASQSGRSKETVEKHLQWFLLENPARQPKDPIGFGLRSSDQLVGCILCSPQEFCFGRERIVLMGSSSFYVADRYRGHGGRIFLQYCRLGNQRPLFGTSANADAAALWKAAGASSIPNSDGELFGVLRWPPVVEEFIHRRNSNRLLARLTASPVSNLVGLFRPLKIHYVAADVLQPLMSAEQVNDLPIQYPSAKLTSSRDVAYVHWRYFSNRDATVAVLAFRSQQLDREILVTVNQRLRGYRGHINTLNVLDVYPEVPPTEWLRIVSALVVRYGKTIDAVVLRNQDFDSRKILSERGFQWRAFDAPIGWFLDKSKLLPTNEWYPVPADGDGLI